MDSIATRITFREEFSLRRMTLQSGSCKHFCTCQWSGIPPLLYLAYRLLSMVYFLSHLVFITIMAGQVEMFLGKAWRGFAMLTTQSFIVVCIYQILSAICCTQYFLSHKSGFCSTNEHFRHDIATACDVVSLPQTSTAESLSTENLTKSEHHTQTPYTWLHKAMWMSQTVATGAALLVSVGYWGILWPLMVLRAEEEGDEGPEGPLYVDLSVHAVNTVGMVLDMFLSATPIRLAHAWMLMLYTTWYIAFTVVYWLGGGKGPWGAPHIYPLIDYGGRPGLAAATCTLGPLVVVPLIHAAVWTLYRARAALFSRLHRSRKVAVFQSRDRAVEKETIT